MDVFLKKEISFLNSDLYYTSLYFIHTFIIASTIQHSIDIFFNTSSNWIYKN